MTLRIGIAGAGFMGRDHIRHIEQSGGVARTTRFLDRNASNRALTQELIPEAKFCESVEELLTEIDALVIATHADSHEDLTRQALAAGIPVLVEKPLTRDSDSALRIVRLEQQLPTRMIQVGHMRRYHKPYLELKEIIDSGQHGQPLMLHFAHRLSSYRANAAPDETITNALVHEIDIASWLLGETIVDTTVHRVRSNSTQSVAGLVDPVFIVMHSESGVLITVSNNAASGSGYEIHTEAVLERASITLDHSHHLTRIRSAGLDGRPIPETYLPLFKDAYEGQMTRWLKAVAAGTNLDAHGATAWDGYRATLAAEATALALQRNETVHIEYPTP